MSGLGRYVLLKHLASGGMADVLLARSDGIEGFERHVVIKRIRPELARDQRFVRMFLDEARVAATLHHQHIVQVHDIGEADGEYFIAMEYVHGEDVRRLLSNAAKQRVHVPLRYVLAIVSAAAAALHHAHEQRGSDRRPLNIVHRDVSPSNILVGYDGAIKLLDFGIVTASTLHETRSGSLKGKLSYMSPEQCKGMPVDRRTDIYALGVVLYELATTTRMIKGDSDYQVMDHVVHGRIAPPQSRRQELPGELSNIIMRALATNRDDRYATAEQLRLALDQFAEDAGLTASSSAISKYMHKQFGDRPEPWLDLTDQAEVRLEDMPSKVHDSGSSIWTESPVLGDGSMRAMRGSDVRQLDDQRHISDLRRTGSIPFPSGRLPVIAGESPARAADTPPPFADRPVPAAWEPPAQQAPRGFPLAKVALIAAVPLAAAAIWLVTSLGHSAAPPVVAQPAPPPTAPAAQPAPASAPAPEPAAAAPAPLDVEPASTAAAATVARADKLARGADPASLRKPRPGVAAASPPPAVTTRPAARPAIAATPEVVRTDPAEEHRPDPGPAALPPAPPPAPAPPPPPVPPAPAVAVAVPPPTPAAPAAPQLVAPITLEAFRIAGERTITPDPATMDAIARSGTDKLVSAYKVCITATGAVDMVTQMKGSGFPVYDEKIRNTIRRDWRYRPYLVEGKPQAVCTAIRFIYSQKA